MKTINTHQHKGFPFLCRNGNGFVQLTHNEEIEVGDEIIVNNDGMIILFNVVEITERRPARGNWEGIANDGSLAPTWFNLKTEMK